MLRRLPSIVQRLSFLPIQLTPSKRMSSSETPGSIEDLLKQFSTQTSPFYLPPGVRGPADETEIIPNYTVPASSLPPSTPITVSSQQPPQPPSSSSHHHGVLPDASHPLPTWTGVETVAGWVANRRKILENVASRFDVSKAIEWPVAWGDCDRFGHVNNVRYVGYFESARLSFISTLNLPQEHLNDLLGGRNVGFIVKSHNIVYKPFELYCFAAPVNHPDSLILLNRTHSVGLPAAPSSFKVQQEAYSLTTARLVSTCETELVIYDYNANRKAPMPDSFKQALLQETVGEGPVGGSSKL